jgi:hypothetical protein
MVRSPERQVSCESCNGTGTTETFAEIIDELAKGDELTPECTHCLGAGCDACSGEGYLCDNVPPNLRLLDAWIAERLGWERMERPSIGYTLTVLQWKRPKDGALLEQVPAYTTDPAACKVLLDEMRTRTEPIDVTIEMCAEKVWIAVAHVDFTFNVEHKDLETAVAMCFSRWKLGGES